MARTTKQDWLEAGLLVLAEQGAPALTIERLAALLGVTKGSFYHHFQGLPGYKAALLDYLEAHCADLVRNASQSPTSPAQRIGHLFEAAALAAPDVEVAVRAWSLQDEHVRRVQERVDSHRIAFAQSAYRQIAPNDEQALLLSRLAYAVMVGSTQVQPPLSPAVRRQLFNEFLQLLPIESNEQA